MSQTFKAISSRAQFLRGALVAAVGWCLQALKPSTEAIASGTAGAPSIHLDMAKIGTRWVDNEFMVFNAATDGTVFLNAAGRDLWQQIAGGVTDLDQLVHYHSQASGQSLAVSSFQVIVFLEELDSQRILKFNLPKDINRAPLLDASLSGSTAAASMSTGEEGDAGVILPKPPPPFPPKPPKPPFGKSRSACKTVCV